MTALKECALVIPSLTERGVIPYAEGGRLKGTNARTKRTVLPRKRVWALVTLPDQMKEMSGCRQCETKWALNRGMNGCPLAYRTKNSSWISLGVSQEVYR